MSLGPDLSSLVGDIHALDGYAVRVAPEPRVNPGVNPESPNRTVWENTIRGRDVQNGPVVVGTDSKCLVHVPSGSVYEVRIANDGPGSVNLAIAQVATLNHFPLVINQIVQWRISGEVDVNGISAAGTNTLRVMVSEMG